MNSRIALFFISVLFFSQAALAQEEVYVVPPTKPFGFYGAIAYAVQPLPNDGLEYLPGLSAGLVIDKNWMVGISVSPVNSFLKYEYFGNSGQLNYLNSGYTLGMLDIAYTLLPDHKAHPIFQLQFGGGEAWMKSADGKEFTTCNVLAVHPKMGVQFNAVQWLRIDAVVGYQLMYGLNDFFGKDPFNGPVAGLNLRFGKFLND
jgi:hypothetical protein